VSALWWALPDDMVQRFESLRGYRLPAPQTFAPSAHQRRKLSIKLVQISKAGHADAVISHALVQKSRQASPPSRTQASEYPAVVIPVLTQHYAMLQRNLLYTGVTRGKRLVELVGQKKAVAIAVRNVSGRRRWSKLNEWLRPRQPVSRPIGIVG
jgi:hypothetical protein